MCSALYGSREGRAVWRSSLIGNAPSTVVPAGVMFSRIYTVITPLLWSILIAVATPTTATAAARLTACGDVQLEAEAQCQLDATGGCQTQCSDLAFDIACRGAIEAECVGARCDVEVNTDCSANCEAECASECTGEPGAFDCEAACRGRCSGRCEAHCDARVAAQCEGSSASASCEATARAECEAACEVNCSGECHARCDVEAPELDCEAHCEGSCDVACKVDASAACRIDCHAAVKADCQARLQGECRVACQSPEGALFCDGQYIDHGDHLQECISALNEVLNAHVQTEGTADGACSGARCEGAAKGSLTTNCTLTAAGQGTVVRGWGYLALWLAASTSLRARRRTLPARRPHTSSPPR